jgi:hypothetical protein
MTMPGTETTNDRVVFEGIVKSGAGPAYVAFYKMARRPDGQVRTISFEVPVHDKGLLSRLAELEAGAEIDITIETDWSAKDIPHRVLGFSRSAQATRDKQAA